MTVQIFSNALRRTLVREVRPFFMSTLLSACIVRRRRAGHVQRRCTVGSVIRPTETIARYTSCGRNVHRVVGSLSAVRRGAQDIWCACRVSNSAQMKIKEVVPLTRVGPNQIRPCPLRTARPLNPRRDAPRLRRGAQCVAMLLWCYLACISLLQCKCKMEVRAVVV